MSDKKIECQICGELIHSVQLHIKETHPEITLAKYREDYPEAPLLSEIAEEKLRKNKEKTPRTPEQKIKMAGVSTASIVPGDFSKSSKKPMHELFSLRKTKSAMNAKGDAIPITAFPRRGRFVDLIPDVDNKYIFPIELLKNVLLGIELNIPTYLWGHAGVGKSSLYEQIAACTGRPYMRVQHTANTEEAHIVGQMLANETGTYYEPGPLALAMKHGWVYNADEYDFAHASVSAVYQPVLEGKPLIIKEAPEEWRVVQPHKNFRFCATGNTNGSGDETGLYQGTNLGNAANYSRFGITEHVTYMTEKQEAGVIAAQSGIVKEDAEKLVEFAGKVREAFDSGTMGSTIGPRELIYAASIGLRKASWRQGLQLAYINRMSAVDREIAEGLAQRVFG